MVSGLSTRRQRPTRPPGLPSRRPRQSTPAHEERSARAIIAACVERVAGRDACASRRPDELEQGHEQEAGADQRHTSSYQSGIAHLPRLRAVVVRSATTPTRQAVIQAWMRLTEPLQRKSTSTRSTHAIYLPDFGDQGKGLRGRASKLCVPFSATEGLALAAGWSRASQ